MKILKNFFAGKNDSAARVAENSFIGSEKFFNGLNHNQIDAIKNTEGYVRIIAGAGSGKTKVLVNRYAYIIETLGISPKNILCVTFTNRAANEMKLRIQKILSTEPTNDFICTFHGFCVKILREDIHRIRYPKTFSISDVEDQKSFLRECYENLGIGIKDITHKRALAAIHDYKTKNPYIYKFIDSDIMDTSVESGKLETRLIMEYIRLQKKNFALDFEDLMHFAMYILLKYDDVAVKWQSQLHYIMVDETQDNSSLQWKFVDLLAVKHRNLFVVGDPDQSIYEWRGAKPEILVNFDATHIPCKTIVLDQNYRSASGILNVANAIIANNSNRVSKNMFTKAQSKATAVHVHSKTENDEADWVSNHIKEYAKSGNLGDLAILFRASSISRSFEQSLIRNSIPYIIYGGIRFFERKEVKDALSYLRLIESDDDIAFLRVINNPSRKLGKAFLDKLKAESEKCGTKLFATLKSHIAEKDFSKQGAIEFLSVIEDARKSKSEQRISDMLTRLLENSHFLEMIRNDGDQDRIDNIEELMNSIKVYENSRINEEEIVLSEYLQDISLYTNIDYKEDSQFVKLMTIHQSKGMEFKVVYCVGMSEGVFPSMRAIRERRMAALEEERRLAYVAVTRAESMLFLTESEGFSNETGNKYPSRFIYEVKKGSLEKCGIVPPEIVKGLECIIEDIDKMIHAPEISELEIGNRVNHAIFGEGIIKDRTEDSYEIIFNETGTAKLIRIEYQGLEKL